MCSKEPHFYFDLDYGGTGAQQDIISNGSVCVELPVFRFAQACTTFSNQTPVLESSYNILVYKSSSSDTWESTNMFPRDYPTEPPHSPLSMCVNNEEMINLGVYNTEAHLVMKTPPEHRFRYRYDTEMSGTHGSLQGIRSGSEKSAPEVQLVNYPHEALIRVSLVTCNEMGERFPHPHNLFIKEKMYQKKIYENQHNKPLTKTGHYSDPHYIRVGIGGVDYVARFEGMCIISSKKENLSASIKEKLEIRNVEQGMGLVEREHILKKVDEAVKLVDLDFVSLCFEAFRQEEGRLARICPPLYSDPIGNAKSANTGKLKISRINKCSGSCKGGDEIWLLVEKINKKGLIIRFFEESDGKILWESFIKGDDIILHHQYAIIFKTPPYRDLDITTEVKVLMRLERSLQLSQACDFSEPITFVYEPLKNRNYRNENIYKKESILSTKQTHIKRSRTESPIVPNIGYQYKRKKDEQDCLEFDLDFDNIFSDNGSDACQSWLERLNVEEFLQLMSEESDETLQRDGISSTIRTRKDLFQFLHLYSKCDENEIKKLTDRINNIKFSAENSKIESGRNDEKKDVEDAVSTLLSLREKRVDINRSKSDFDKNDCNNLHEAVIQNKPDVLRKMLKASKFFLKDDNDNTPLHLSLILGHDSCTESLLDCHRELINNITAKNKQGKTPLHIAVGNGNLRHVERLIEFGADVNDTETKSKRNALHIAVVIRNVDIARYLIEKTDVKLDALDGNGQSAFHIAQMWMPPEKAQFEKLFKQRIKQEKNKDPNGDVKNSNDVNLDKLYETLNETGSWKFLAEIWNCSYLIKSAEETENPAEYIFNSSEQINGEIEIESLRNLLDAIKEKKGLIVLDEILARKFL